ncbi:response regulator receiver domain-containing protein [Flavobacterium chryseum]|uniref:response regulator n=1 Tax=Flavobacterium sp. P3160 TaxID=2512113 RepID=UPI00105F2C2F|nr:response regulator [Flavobacterium sp. P3160]TDO73157.1 response regulator receiver domain-containing protein [Flavobacterium sp. P3160]
MSTELPPKFETVMIIDDNVIDLYITSRMITQNNFAKNVLLYTAAEEAMQYLQDNEDNIPLLPQVIFVDIYMPLMSGFEFLDAYDKLSPSLKKYAKAYIISSTIDNEDIARSINNKNVVSFHVKPITKEFLDRII